MNLYRRLLNAPEDRAELLLSTPQPKFPTDWSADARFLLYDSLDPKRGYDIWALPPEGDPFEVVRTDFNERLAQFSPDGTWIAYQSDKTGRYEIYVRPFPGPGDDSRVSIDGGAQVRWNPNGKELFYIAADDRLMAVPIGFICKRQGVRIRDSAWVVRHERGQHGHKHEQTAIRRFSGRPVVCDEFRCGRNQRLAHHGHPELEAGSIAHNGAAVKDIVISFWAGVMAWLSSWFDTSRMTSRTSRSGERNGTRAAWRTKCVTSCGMPCRRPRKVPQAWLQHCPALSASGPHFRPAGMAWSGGRRCRLRLVDRSRYECAVRAHANQSRRGRRELVGPSTGRFDLGDERHRVRGPIRAGPAPTGPEAAQTRGRLRERPGRGPREPGPGLRLGCRGLSRTSRRGTEACWPAVRISATR